MFILIINRKVISRRTRPIIWQNIIIALRVKLVFIVLGEIRVVTLWEAVIADLVVALLAILNASRVLQTRER